ncbi:MAG: hypothetical protein GXP52_04070 [Deltaproteobacteria bacterium]|nr:hypothetical protein [Deltaproteobacteria bacterium]
MVSSGDPQKMDVALRAIEKIPPDEVAEYLSSCKLDEKTFDLITRALQVSSAGTSAMKDYAHQALSVREFGPAPSAQEENPTDNDTVTLTQRVQGMTVGEKIKLALKGDKEARALLLKDTNREIYMSVLENPGLKESEVEMMTKNTATNTDILRTIAKNREWVANRNIMKNLVYNPKTPVELSVRFLNRMKPKDLEVIAKSRNLPMVVRTTAERLVARKEKGR